MGIDDLKFKFMASLNRGTEKGKQLNLQIDVPGSD